MDSLFSKPPVLGFAAFSGTGKTTLLEALLPMFQERNLRVGVIKHSHHDFEIDRAEKDSFRLRKAGAQQMLIASSFRSPFCIGRMTLSLRLPVTSRQPGLRCRSWI